MDKNDVEEEAGWNEEKLEIEKRKTVTREEKTVTCNYN